LKIRGQAGGLTLASGGLLAFASLLSPPDGPILCLFRAGTSLPCPSCGMTRGFFACGHGDFFQALAFNIVSPAVYLGVWILFALALAQLISGSDVLGRAWHRFRGSVLLVVVPALAVAWIVNLWKLFSG
jgi:hypothetical protein